MAAVIEIRHDCSPDGGTGVKHMLISGKRSLHRFLRATAVPAGTAEARISYGNSVCPSVRLSVTTRWYTKLR